MPTRTMRSTASSSTKKANKSSKNDDIPKRNSRSGARTVSNAERKVEERNEHSDEQMEEEEEEESLHSDALDDEDEEPITKTRKRKRRGADNGKASPKKRSTPRRKKKTEEEDYEQSDVDLKEGQEVIGAVVRAPETGRVPPGQISRNTLDFLSQLKKPECNNREWFRLHEPVYRLAEKEWKSFIEAFTDILVEADSQIPHLPPKDVTHRIYRDVRFSNDKTPYKTGLSASFSRSGRKGIFAGYHICIRPGGNSLIAAGTWQPGKNELSTIRNNLLRSSTRLRRIISTPQFVGLFGEAKPHPKGQRRNIFGMDDELKVAPKGVSKGHQDIDLLKCRSFAVVHRFTDQQVLQSDWKDELGRLVTIMRPFVYCINDLMTIPDAGSSEAEGEDDQEILDAPAIDDDSE